jgi:hypothetical protein
MSSDWRAGSIRLIGALLAILETAGRHHRPVRFELTEAKLVFGRDGGFAVADAAVLRATDADLR